MAAISWQYAHIDQSLFCNEREMFWLLRKQHYLRKKRF